MLAVAALSGGALAQTVVDPTLTVRSVVPQFALDQPTTLAFLGNGDFLVLEKATGRVRRVLAGVVQPLPVLTVQVNDESERGLLGIAINRASPPAVFLYFTEATAGGTAVANRVYRYTWNAATSQLVSPTLLLDLPVTFGPNHNGGVLALGPTGQFPGSGDGAALYAVIGDLGRDGQLQNNAGGDAPDDTGVIFRVLQDGSAAPGNPFTPYCSVTTTQTCAIDANCSVSQTCRTKVARYFAYGIRNSFGLALDPVTGLLWDTENGPTTMDEVNQVSSGMNSGWKPIMGPDSLDSQGTGDLFNIPGAGLTYSDPEFSWNATVAPTGIVFPYGSSLGSAYDSVAIVADNTLGQLYSLPLNASRTGFVLTGGLADLVANTQVEANSARFGQGFGAVTDLKVAPDGELYVVDLAGTIRGISGPRAPSTQIAPAIPALSHYALVLLALFLGIVLVLRLDRARG